jgi:hypothetical protein
MVRMVIHVVHTAHVGFVGDPSSPKDYTEPGYGDHQHIRHSAEHEHLHGTVAIFQRYEIKADKAIADAENEPANQTGRQQMTGQTPEAKNGNQSQEAEHGNGRKIAEQRKLVKKGHTIGYDHPGAENHRQRRSSEDTRPDGCVMPNLQPGVSLRLMRSD